MEKNTTAGPSANGPIGPNSVPTSAGLVRAPQANGELTMVAVEVIILASALPPNSAPCLDGHLPVFVDGPNRYGLPPFCSLTRLGVAGQPSRALRALE